MVEMCARTVEALLIGDIVNQQDAHGTSVVGSGDCAEALLTSGIPYLQLDTLAVQLYRADLEVDADGGDEGGGEGVFAEAQQTAGLSYSAVAYEEELDLEGVMCVSWGDLRRLVEGLCCCYVRTRKS